MVKTKELIICISLIFCLVLAFATNVFALDLEEDWEEDEDVETIGDEEDEDIGLGEEDDEDTGLDEDEEDVGNDVGNEEKPKNTMDKMPDTGIDYSVLSIIAVTGISAIYAYKKIRDYNV